MEETERTGAVGAQEERVSGEVPSHVSWERWMDRV